MTVTSSASRVVAFSKKAVLIAMTASVFSFASVASASAPASVDVLQKTINFSDLDLSKQNDTERLYRRLRSASREVCGISKEVSAEGALRNKACAQNALSNAVAAVGHPSLTALHTAKSDVKLAQSTKSDAAKS